MLTITHEMLLDPRVVEYGTVRLASGAGKYELKNEILCLFGSDVHIHASAYEDYLTECIKKINEVSKISVREISNRLQTFLWSVMGDLEERTRDRLLAAKEIRRLHGLDRVDIGAEEQAKEIRDFLNETNKLSFQEKVRKSRGTFDD